MEFRNCVNLPYPRQIVWDGLNDPDVLRACIPNCESFDTPTRDHFEVVSVLKIGMIKARFEGEIDLSDMDAPCSYRISGAGKGGVAGYASGQARVWLDETEGGTRLTYEASADVGGKIAQMGSRLIDSVASRLADQFFEAFEATLARREAGEDISASADGAATANGAGPAAVDADGGRIVETNSKSSSSWLIPFAVGLGCGVLIGALGVLALG